MGKLLLFHMNLFQAGAIRNVCQTLHLEAEEIPKEKYNQKLGSLAQIMPLQKIAAYQGPDLPHEMMVFVGMNETLDSFLAEYKKAGIPPIPHKAVLTPTNCNWTALQLFEDLEEHVALNRK